MTGFTLHTTDTAPEGSRAALAAVAKAYGFIPNLHAVLAESPAALIGLETLFALAATSSLTPAEVQAVALVVSESNGCGYCVMGHTFVARSVGVPDEEIAVLRAGGVPQEARLAALVVFVRDVVATRGKAGPAAVEALLAAGFSRAAVLDVVAVIAAKTIANYANLLCGTPDEGFMADPALAWVAA